MASSRASCLTTAPSLHGEEGKTHSQAPKPPAGPQPLRGDGESHPKALLFWNNHQEEVRKETQAQGSWQGTSGPCIESLVCPSIGPNKSFRWQSYKRNVGRALRGARDQKVGGTFKLTENCKCYKEESD